MRATLQARISRIHFTRMPAKTPARCPRADRLFLQPDIETHQHAFVRHDEAGASARVVRQRETRQAPQLQPTRELSAPMNASTWLALELLSSTTRTARPRRP